MSHSTPPLEALMIVRSLLTVALSLVPLPAPARATRLLRNPTISSTEIAFE